MSTDLVNDPHPYDNTLLLKDAIGELSTRLQSDASHTPEEAQRQAEAYTPHLAALAVTSEQASSILGAVFTANKTQPTAEQRAAFDRDSRTAMVSEYGTAGAAQALRDARTLLDKLPALKANLTKLGIESHPDVVRTLAHRAALARRNGKL